jgi:hypothetical protein
MRNRDASSTHLAWVLRAMTWETQLVHNPVIIKLSSGANSFSHIPPDFVVKPRRHRDPLEIVKHCLHLWSPPASTI